jgi:hypothetical protein
VLLSWLTCVVLLGYFPCKVYIDSNLRDSLEFANISLLIMLTWLIIMFKGELLIVANRLESLLLLKPSDV